MKQSKLQFQIDQLRQDKNIAATESIAVMVFSLFVSAFLPQLLVRYVYADQALMEAPALLEYIPVAAFTVGALFFLYAVVSNIMRMIRINQLQAELMALPDDEYGCNCDHDHDHENWEELDELDRMVEEAMAESKATKSAAASKKTATKTKKAKKATSKKK
jgi:hypothetical protein